MKALPGVTPDSRPFWSAAAKGELWIQRCVSSGRFFFYPRTSSPFVTGGSVEWVRASGRATLYSYNILHRPAPGFDGPHALAVVELEEGPRMMTNIVGIANTPESLVLDMPLQVSFEQRGEVAVPVFGPRGA